MYKIAVMGDMDSIYGFAAVGLDICPVDEPAMAAGLLKELTEKGYAVIYVTESLCPYIVKEIEASGGGALPAIVPIPGAYGNSGYGMARINKFVEQAVGSDILFGKE